MTSFEAIEGRLLSADALADALGACWAAFEWAGQVAYSFAEPGSAHFATWLSVTAPACEGRDAEPMASGCKGESQSPST